MELHNVTILEVLEAREARVRCQQGLLTQFGRPMVSFTMNIAGPVKDSPLIRRGFGLGCEQLDRQLQRVRARVLHRELLYLPTGPEGYWVVDLPAAALKDLTVELEEGSELGRLFDLDVLDPNGVKLDRAVERGCLICGKPGRGCARSRAHSVAELQAKTEQLLTAALERLDRETAAQLAVRSLLYEVAVTPKPGLVDRENSGSHTDMDVYTFLASAPALWPYFHTCVQIGQQTANQPPEKTFAALRWPGKQAEHAMLRATDGVNTHKGAIFSLGILCGALGRLDHALWQHPQAVVDQCAAMTRGVTAADFAGLTEETAVTAGQKLYLHHGITGVRGQLEAGLPAVLHHGLPVLEQGLDLGKTPDEAGVAALLALIAASEDTNLMIRGGLEAQRQAAAEAAALLAREPYPNRETLEALDRAYREKNLSPGGSADLLAICWMLHFLRTP